ncbi:hypothetical protein [Algoriphagus resistens]|uniref:hypothetical protein n=1 Tax=Algoriphagus resistens TaxID=1750590 RepID=UPI001E4CEB7D|nr:hypothetical protein [Algoriphagus resistens]
MRAIRYDREGRSDAGMLLFRHGNREISQTKPLLDLVIVLNSVKDEAYLYLEATNVEWPLEIRVFTEGKQAEFRLENGNNSELLAYVRQLRPWIEKDADFEIKDGATWKSIWSKPKEKKALKTLLEDYFRLINEQE